jgi:hypothetical protein
VEERLDGALVNQPWRDMFPHCSSVNVTTGASYQSLLLLKKRHGLSYYAGYLLTKTSSIANLHFSFIVLVGWEVSFVEPNYLNYHGIVLCNCSNY